MSYAEEIAFNDPPAGAAEKMVLNQHLQRLTRFSHLSSLQRFFQQVRRPCLRRQRSQAAPTRPPHRRRRCTHRWPGLTPVSVSPGRRPQICDQYFIKYMASVISLSLYAAYQYFSPEYVELDLAKRTERYIKTGKRPLLPHKRPRSHSFPPTLAALQP